MKTYFKYLMLVATLGCLSKDLLCPALVPFPPLILGDWNPQADWDLIVEIRTYEDAVKKTNELAPTISDESIDILYDLRNSFISSNGDDGHQAIEASCEAIIQAVGLAEVLILAEYALAIALSDRSAATSSRASEFFLPPQDGTIRSYPSSLWKMQIEDIYQEARTQYLQALEFSRKGESMKAREFAFRAITLSFHTSGNVSSYFDLVKEYRPQIETYRAQHPVNVQRITQARVNIASANVNYYVEVAGPDASKADREADANRIIAYINTFDLDTALNQANKIKDCAAYNNNLLSDLLARMTLTEIAQAAEAFANASYEEQRAYVDPTNLYSEAAPSVPNVNAREGVDQTTLPLLRSRHRGV